MNDDKSKKTRLLIITLSALVVVMFGIFAINPVITGYSIYKQVSDSKYSVEDYAKNIKEMEEKVVIYETNLSACADMRNQLMDDFKNFTNIYSACVSDLKSGQATNTILEANNAQLQKELEQKTIEAEQLKKDNAEALTLISADLDKLAQNSANNICCKAKVDDSRINSYEVTNNKITCLADGEKPIIC